MTDQKDLKIETEIGIFAIREFVKKLKAWIDSNWCVDDEDKTYVHTKELLEYAESLLPPEQTDEVKL
jgi:hypothetical protein